MNLLRFDISNRRYTGSKRRLINWIHDVVDEQCCSCNSFADLFAGTGIVSYSFLDRFSKIVINDFLFSNEVIYKAFFNNNNFNEHKLIKISLSFNALDRIQLEENYFSQNFGNKFFSNSDAKLIGRIRDLIDELKDKEQIDESEWFTLLASLLYSVDKCANTVGHYEAYIQNNHNFKHFEFGLIKPVDTSSAIIEIFREDANELAGQISCDIAFLDPPYNSRQYSRFYHLLETLTKWDCPKLTGTAMKPPAENMSDYCRNNAVDAFRNLVNSLDCKYIAVTYNNAYNTRSSSSRNKIEFDDLVQSLEHCGETQIFQHNLNRFNAGKTQQNNNNKEFLFITKVC